MEKNSSQPTRRQRFAVDDGADLIDCSGKQCQSCTTGLVADCVAICLCPCSVVSFLALALVKLPWMIGRRCLQQSRQKRKLIGRRGERKGGGVAAESGGGAASEEGLPPWFGEEEAERIWVQLHQTRNKSGIQATIEHRDSRDRDRMRKELLAKNRLQRQRWRINRLE